MKPLCAHLKNNERNQDHCKDCGARQISQLHRHTDGVAAGFTERGRKDFDDPKAQSDGGHFRKGVAGRGELAGISHRYAPSISGRFTQMSATLRRT